MLRMMIPLPLPVAVVLFDTSLSHHPPPPPFVPPLLPLPPHSSSSAASNIISPSFVSSTSSDPDHSSSSSSTSSSPLPPLGLSSSSSATASVWHSFTLSLRSRDDAHRALSLQCVAASRARLRAVRSRLSSLARAWMALEIMKVRGRGRFDPAQEGKVDQATTTTRTARTREQEGQTQTMTDSIPRDSSPSLPQSTSCPSSSSSSFFLPSSSASGPSLSSAFPPVSSPSSSSSAFESLTFFCSTCGDEVPHALFQRHCEECSLALRRSSHCLYDHQAVRSIQDRAEEEAELLMRLCLSLPFFRRLCGRSPLARF